MGGELGGKWGKVWKRGEWGKCESVANKSLINLLLQLPWWVRMLFRVDVNAGKVLFCCQARSRALLHSQRKFCDTASPLYVTSSQMITRDFFRKGKWFPTLTFPFYSYNGIGFWATKNSFINNAFGFAPRLWILFSWLKLCWHQFGGKRQFQIEPAATPILSFCDWQILCWLSVLTLNSKNIKNHFLFQFHSSPTSCLSVEVPVLNRDVNLVFGIWGKSKLN